MWGLDLGAAVSDAVLQRAERAEGVHGRVREGQIPEDRLGVVGLEAGREDHGVQPLEPAGSALWSKTPAAASPPSM